jgi:hypothetical protein
MDPAGDWVVSGKGALDFDGSNDFVNVEHSNSLNLSRFTISAWVNVRSTSPANFIVSKCVLNGNGSSQFELRIFSGSLQLLGNAAGNSVNSSAGISANAWIHAVGSYDGATSTLYSNGLSRATSTAINYNSTSTPLVIGTRDDRFAYFSGFIDDVTIYNTALTANEVREIYRLGRGYGVFPEPDFDEGFAAAAGFKAYWARRQSQLIGGGV